jgi:hypothetical protein
MVRLHKRKTRKNGEGSDVFTQSSDRKLNDGSKMDCKYYATIVITGISVSIIKLSKHI